MAGYKDIKMIIMHSYLDTNFLKKRLTSWFRLVMCFTISILEKCNMTFLQYIKCLNISNI